MTRPEIEQIRHALLALVENRQHDEAWHTIINLTFPIALATANRILRGAMDLARDAAWEAFARIARYADFQLFALIAPESFLRYLKQVTRRTSYDLLRSLARRSPEVEADLAIRAAAIQSGAPTPEETLAAEELYRDIAKILCSDERRLLTLILEGFSLNEIGKVLNITYNTAGVRLHRLREKIRNYLKTEG